MKYLVVAVIVIFLLLLGGYGLLWFLSGPVFYRRRVNDDLTKFFEELLTSIYETGYLVIMAPNKQRLVQFRRYKQNEKAALRFDFPKVPGYEQYYELLKKILTEQSVDYQITSDEKSVSYVTVDLRDDWVRATDLAKMVLLDVLKLRPEDTIKIAFGK